jgi:SAM-dependent MidA family methyltransferase
MERGNRFLVDLIRDRIEAHGPVSFAWFMEQALYHPTGGYYSSGHALIGRKGDYFTNVSVGPLFGKLLAAQLTEMWEQMAKPDNFVIVEQGAHSGQLAQDVLAALRTSWPEFFKAVRCCIIEPFPVFKEQQERALAEFKRKASWVSSIEALEPFTGVHLSNELLDAMPVHLICLRKDSPVAKPPGPAIWCEQGVGLEQGEFVFVPQPIADGALENHLARIAEFLPRLDDTDPESASAYQMEVNLEALGWTDQISTKLKRGFVLTVDYGFARSEFYAPHRTAGTLQCRAGHHRIASPFTEIGRSDITAHVEWTSIVERAHERKLLLAGFADQHHFLTGIISHWPQLADPADARSRRALQTLLHPEMLGRAFQVLALAKNVDPQRPLAGFKFARNPRTALGLTE